MADPIPLPGFMVNPPQDPADHPPDWVEAPRAARVGRVRPNYTGVLTSSASAPAAPLASSTPSSAAPPSAPSAKVLGLSPLAAGAGLAAVIGIGVLLTRGPR